MGIAAHADSRFMCSDCTRVYGDCNRYNAIDSAICKDGKSSCEFECKSSNDTSFQSEFKPLEPVVPTLPNKPTLRIYGAMSVQEDQPENYGYSWNHLTLDKAWHAALNTCLKYTTNPDKCKPDEVVTFEDSCGALAIAENPKWGKGSYDAPWAIGQGLTNNFASNNAKQRCEEKSGTTCNVVKSFCVWKG